MARKSSARNSFQHFHKRKAKAMSNKLLSSVSVGGTPRKKFCKAKRVALSGDGDRQEVEDRKVLRMGSFNVNGLNLESSWAIEKLVVERDFDVSTIWLVA